MGQRAAVNKELEKETGQLEEVETTQNDYRKSVEKKLTHAELENVEKYRTTVYIGGCF